MVVWFVLSFNNKGVLMMDYKNIYKVYEGFKAKLPFQPKVAVVLGSGLGDFAEKADIKAIIDYKDIEGMPVSTVTGHKGRFVFAYVNEIPVVFMQGRVHFYEGYDISEVVLPIRLLHLMGAEYLFLTNAAGGINSNFKCGDIMMITDHISSFIRNPLIGPNIEEFGTRFPDMSAIYDKELSQLMRDVAAKNNIDLKEGVYVQLTGPSYETPAEIQMLKKLGIDAVGMSTVVEAIAARHCGMRVFGFSCISNLAAGISPVPLTHEEVKETCDRVAPVISNLIYSMISELR